MININEIKKYYSINFVGFDRGILREYLQYKILDIIFRSEIGNKLVFLGGTAIRICYGSGRFSEDLDFDNFGLTSDEFVKLSLIIKRELELEGYEVEIRNVFKGSFHCYIKISGILQANNLSIDDKEKILIQIDIASYDFNYVPQNYILQKFDVFRNIKIIPLDILLSMKVAAIFGRKKMKGRDFYDVVYLLGLGDFNYDYLSLKLNIKNKEELKEKLLNSITDLNMAAMARDVYAFLINKDDQEMVLRFQRYIEQRLQ
jgi:predicted nucleotidyltransferase component of viral defense system